MKTLSSLLVVICVLGLACCGPKWESPGKPGTTAEEGTVLLFEPGPTHQVGELNTGFWKIPLELQPVRRVSNGRVRYTVRFRFLGKSWEEEDATIRNLVNAYDAYEGKKPKKSEVILNSWVCVQGTSGTFEYSLLDDEMNIDGHSVGKAATFVKAARNVLADLAKMTDVSPAVKP